MNNILQKKKSEDSQVRRANMDLLRIVAMIFVIILHYNNAGIGKAFLYTKGMQTHYTILLYFEMLAICAVNVYVMLSGYFQCTSTSVKIWKVVRLYIDVIFFSVFTYFLYCITGTATFSVPVLLNSLIPLNWYVAVYSGLYLISPYLNQLLRNLTKSQFRFMLLVFFFVLSVWPSGAEFLGKAFDFEPDFLSTISNTGSGDGYTLANFILMYFFGAYCRMHGNENISSRKILYAVIVFFGSALLNMVYGKVCFTQAISYCNPFVVIGAVAIFVIFQNISIRSKLINAAGSCAFGAYLMHPFFYQFCQIERFVTGNPIVIPFHILLASSVIFIICALIYQGYRKITEKSFRKLQNLFGFLSYDINGFIQ